MHWSLLCVLAAGLAVSSAASSADQEQRIQLPAADVDGGLPLQSALQERRSIREFSRASLSPEDVAQLLWAAQGITAGRELRTAPSAGALYPLELYLLAGNVDGLSPGVYRYRPKKHDLVLLASGDHRRPLAAAALGQDWVRRAPAVLVFTAVYERTLRKYGQRGHRYVHMEVGHAAQNVYLQATSLDLGTVMVGAFIDEEVSAALQLPPDHAPLGLMPVGHN